MGSSNLLPQSVPNPFATFQLPVRPWLPPETVQEAFLKLAAKWHPDTNAATEAQEEFHKVNSAHQILKDPVKRLEAALQMENPEVLAAASENTIPSNLPDIFMTIATFQREVTTFFAQSSPSPSPVERAVQHGELRVLRSDIEHLMERVEHQWVRCENQVRAADLTWERRTGETLRHLASIQREMRYLQRWREQLRETKLKLEEGL
jgi:curved DNA-binding protein CbpA